MFADQNSQGQWEWTNPGEDFDPDALRGSRRGNPEGVWFLSNPVNGRWTLNDRGRKSRRSRQNVTSFRHMVVESDKVSADLWLAVLVQLPLSIVAIYTSGGRSIHALIRLNATSKEQWDERADLLKPSLITLGADEKAMSAVRLTRLPGCERVETGQMQRLLYLNPSSDGTPIHEQEVWH